MLPSDISRRISVLDGNRSVSLPDWAAALVWLGYWCRLNQQAGKRLIVFTVLPTRELSAAFAGLGCLIAGASAFEDSLSWTTFKNLPSGSNVFWINKNTMKKYCGEIIGFKGYVDAEFIVVNVIRAPRKAEVGTTLEISKFYFDDYRFSEEKPLSAPKTLSFDAALQSFKSLVENLNPKWIWADGAEVLVLSELTGFENSIEGISLSVDGTAPVAFSELLCMGRNKEQIHAKLRIDHPRGGIDGHFPLAILDGVNAFEKHEHLGSVSNLLILLDRSEYKHDIQDTVLGLSSVSQDITSSLDLPMPEKLAHGIEISAYLIDA